MRPHPTRDPRGHSYGRPIDVGVGGAEAADDVDLRWGVRLFDHGYYWEAHEAWERPFRHAPTGTPRRDLYKALIALAAAGLKVRQGRIDQAVRFAERAERAFEDLRQRCGPACEGLALRSLVAFARRAARDAMQVSGDPHAAVQVVFSSALPAQPGTRT